MRPIFSRYSPLDRAYSLRISRFPPRTLYRATRRPNQHRLWLRHLTPPRASCDASRIGVDREIPDSDD